MIALLQDEITSLRQLHIQTACISTKVCTVAFLCCYLVSDKCNQRENLYSRPSGVQEVPFPDGVRPWSEVLVELARLIHVERSLISFTKDKKVVTLPPLTCENSVRELEARELHAYYHEYCPHYELNRTAAPKWIQFVAVLNAIGCGEVV
jgi:hypothetical protein